MTWRVNIGTDAHYTDKQFRKIKNWETVRKRGWKKDILIQWFKCWRWMLNTERSTNDRWVHGEIMNRSGKKRIDCLKKSSFWWMNSFFFYIFCFDVLFDGGWNEMHFASLRIICPETKGSMTMQITQCPSIWFDSGAILVFGTNLQSVLSMNLNASKSIGYHMLSMPVH